MQSEAAPEGPASTSPPLEASVDRSPSAAFEPASAPPPSSHAAAPSSTSGGFPAQPASLGFLVVVTTLSLAADLLSKGWAKAMLNGVDRKSRPRQIVVLKDHLDFIFAQNPGGAWSFLRSLPDTLRRPFFLIVSAAAIVFIISIYRRVHRDQTAMKWGLPLALGGAMGNLVDRMRYGWVVDFVDIYFTRGGRAHHWPTFNVADIAIVVGVALMALDMLRASRAARAMLKEHPSSAA